MFLPFLVLLLIKSFSRKISETLDQAAARQCTCLSGMLFFSEVLELLVAINMSPLCSEVGVGDEESRLGRSCSLFYRQSMVTHIPKPPSREDLTGITKEVSTRKNLHK